MYFSSFAEIIAMGGHGGFVWSSYILFFVLLLGLVLEPLIKRRQIKRQLQQYYRRQKMRENNEGSPSK